MTMNEVVAQESTGLISLVRIDAGVMLRICNYQTNITFNEPEDLQNYVYVPYPFSIPELSKETHKEIPSITITLPITSLISSIISADPDSLMAKEVVIFTTTPDILASTATTKYIKSTFYIVNLAFNNETLSLNLGSKYNYTGFDFPKRRFYKNYCPWVYKDGVNCPYNPDSWITTGYLWDNGLGNPPSSAFTIPFYPTPITAQYGHIHGPLILNNKYTIMKNRIINWRYNFKYFDRQGKPVQNADQDVCGKTLNDCRIRQEATNRVAKLGISDINPLTYNTVRPWLRLPYGGFPSIVTSDPKVV